MTFSFFFKQLYSTNFLDKSNNVVEIKEEYTGNTSSTSSVLSTKSFEDNGVIKISSRSVTGVLASHSQSRDIKIANFSLTLHGTELVTDTELEFNFGNRYGLIGLNGSGKSTLLNCLAEREVPIPSHITIYHLDR